MVDLDFFEYNKFSTTEEELIFKFRFNDMGRFTPILNGLDLRGCFVYPLYYGFPGTFYRAIIRARFRAPILFNDDVLREEMRRLQTRTREIEYAEKIHTMDLKIFNEIKDPDPVIPFLRLNLNLFGSNTPRKVTAFRRPGIGLRLLFSPDQTVRLYLSIKSGEKIYKSVCFGSLLREKKMIGVYEQSSLDMDVGACPNRIDAQTVLMPRKLESPFNQYYPESWLK